MAVDFKATRKRKTIVLGSGIEAGILSLEGRHQEQITISDDKKRREAIDDMLLTCMSHLGKNRNLTKKHVETILREDRKQLLFEIRQLSNDNNPEFRFKYEFPVKKGRKLSDVYSVTFEKEDFPAKPYKWVEDKMLADYAEEKSLDVAKLTDAQKKEALEQEYPIMYDDYEQIIDEHREQRFTLPQTKCEVVWWLVDGATEKKVGKVLKDDDTSSHNYFHLRNPKYIDPEETQKKGKEVQINLPLNDVCAQDLEALRSHMRTIEGEIETSVVVQYKDDATMQANVDLVGTAGFFFPSLAV